MRDHEVDAVVARRDARRYRALLRDLVLALDRSYEALESASVEARGEALRRVQDAARRVERAAWPDGMAARRR